MNVLKPNQKATVFTLLERNTSQHEIARITGIDRKTIRNYQRSWLSEQSNSPQGGHWVFWKTVTDDSDGS